MIQLQAPAKINLFLRALHKRTDGYHELASLLQTIGLADTLTLKLADKDTFSCSDPCLQGEDNLAIKALRLFRRHVNRPFFVACTLEKKIPLQAGLGGGSSDAAAMLIGLNRLLESPLADDELCKLASELGSDVPFFLKGGSAFCQGRGERITPLSPLACKTVWIIKPPFGLSTPEVYRALNIAGLKPRCPHTSLSEHLQGQGEYYNDLEGAALLLRPQLATLKHTLLASGFSTVLLSGSGSAFFCLGDGSPSLSPDHFVCKTRFL